MPFKADLKTILIAVAVVVVSFFVSLKAMDFLSPRGGKAPVLVELPPLPAAPRSSRVMAPVSIALSAIRDAADRGTPRTFQGKADNPVSQVLQNADIGWTASRGPITATGGQDVMTLSTPLTGTLNVTGSLSAKAGGAVSDAIGGLLGNDAAKTDRRHQHQEPQRQCRDQGQHRHHVAAEARRQLAPRAQSRRASESRRHRPQRGGRADQRAGAGQAADRQERRRADRDRAGADEERSRARTERAGAMGKGLPLDPAAGRGRDCGDAGAVAGAEADPGDRGAAEGRRVGGDADHGHRGRDPRHAGRDQAELPVPRHHHHRAADAGRRRHRRADRHAVCRAQQAARGAVRRQDVSGRRLGAGGRDGEARESRCFRQPVADFAAGLRQGKEELISASAPRPMSTSGACRCSTRRSRRCG